MSTDNMVTVIIRTKRTLNISNNSPLLAAREALETVEREVGRLSEESYLMVVWTADSKGLPGRQYFHDLEEVRRATP